MGLRQPLWQAFLYFFIYISHSSFQISNLKQEDYGIHTDFH